VKQSDIKYWLIILFWLSSPSFLVGFIASQVGINRTLINLAFLGMLLVIVIKDFGSSRYTKLQKNIFWLYVLMLIYLILIWNIKILGSGSNRAIFKYLLTAPLFMIVFTSRSFQFQRFINLYVGVAFVLALLSIIQYIGVPLGIISLKSNTLRESMEGSYVGIGGFYSNLEFGNVVGVLSRNQGFFSEPTNFAQFLMLPLAISGYHLFNPQIQFYKKRKILIFVSIALAFLLTFSVANFFGLFIGLLFFSFWSISNKNSLGFGKSRWLISLILFIGISLSLYQFYNITNSSSRKENVIGKKTSSNFENRLWRITTYTNRAIEYPTGDLDYRAKYSHASGVIGSSVITGGWIFLILALAILIHIVFKVVLTSRRGKFLLIYSGFIAYLLPVLWDAHFYEYQLMINIIIISVFIKYEGVTNYSSVKKESWNTIYSQQFLHSKK
jgi:hypothetical protein